MSDNVTISRGLLSDIYAFMDSAYTHVPEWAKNECDMREEWDRLGDEIEELLGWHEKGEPLGLDVLPEGVIHNCGWCTNKTWCDGCEADSTP